MVLGVPILLHLRVCIKIIILQDLSEGWIFNTPVASTEIQHSIWFNKNLHMA